MASLRGNWAKAYKGTTRRRRKDGSDINLKFSSTLITGSLFWNERGKERVLLVLLRFNVLRTLWTEALRVIVNSSSLVQLSKVGATLNVDVNHL